MGRQLPGDGSVILLCLSKPRLHSLALGDTLGARRDATTAVQLGDGDWSPGLLAVIDAARGDTSSSRERIAWLRRAVKPGEPPGVAVGTALAEALFSVGDTSGAFDALEQTRPRGGYLWYALRAMVMVVHWPRSERLDQLIRESRLP